MVVKLPVQRIKKGDHVRWLSLAISLVVLISISFGLMWLLQEAVALLYLPLDKFDWLAYLNVFISTLVCNLTIFIPVPVATPILIATATQWNPVMVAFAASIGGTLGELSGYYAGYLGKRIAKTNRQQDTTESKSVLIAMGYGRFRFLAFNPLFPLI